ncbi:MAG: hypothetical protein ACRELV_00690 [Longimicrobiales bacterium]
MSMLGFVIILALMIPLLAVILDSQLGRALAARLERDAGASSDGLQDRLATLEGEVERLTREVERLDEENRFLQRLIEGRNDISRLPSGDEPA